MSERSPHHKAGSDNNARNTLLLQLAAVESEMAKTWALLHEQSEERLQPYSPTPIDRLPPDILKPGAFYRNAVSNDCKRALFDEQFRERLQLYSKLNSLSPIDQLPAEMKIEIFYNTVQRPLNGRTDTGENPLITPLFLGKICRSWRDFVWSSPILWTNLHLRLLRNSYEAQTNLLRDWLSRTAKYPLSLRLTTDVPPKEWNFNPPIEVFTLFASVSAQWKEIEFFLPGSQACFDAISAVENSLPLLTTATAYLCETEQQLNLFAMAPQLSVLHLYEPTLFAVLAPWHQLQEFTSRGCTVDEIRGFLNKAPNIIRCSFKHILSIILGDSPEPDIFHRLPVLEHLEYLELSFNEVETESALILGPVKLPSLREVSLWGEFAASSAILLSIMTSFHSSHLLENFTFGSTIASVHDLIQVLENIPSAKELHLYFDDQDTRSELLTMELLQRLYPPQTNILLPNLRSFTYIGSTSLNRHIHSFQEMLVYRFRQCALQPTEFDSEQRTVCQIRSVTVMDSSELVFSPDVQDELDNLVQEGLELSLTSVFVPDSPGSESSYSI